MDGAGRAWILHPVDTSDLKAKRRAQAQICEAAALARSIDLDVVEAQTVPLRQFVPATLFGAGKVQEVGAAVADNRVQIVIVDGPLSPIQQRNLEREWHTKVIDRTGLILEIFGARAQTREGVLQVELAALTYQRSRLVRSWTHLERQRGGLGFIGGPGESQIELDRRRIDERITKLRKQLEGIKRTRGLHRSAREQVPYPTIALVGYTNAGKSTLFNRLTGSEVEAVDKLFATLDPTMRLLQLPSGRRSIIADTVGFISDLPTMLVAAFRATLEEVLNADIILHVRDIADPNSDEQAKDVVQVLSELGISEQDYAERTVEVWNKQDLLEGETRWAVVEKAQRQPRSVIVSAASGHGFERLLDTIDQLVASSHAECVVRFSVTRGDVLAWLHRYGEVLDQTEIDGVLRTTVILDSKHAGQLQEEFPDVELHAHFSDAEQIAATR